MEGRQHQIQIGEDVVKIWLGPSELARGTVRQGMRWARSHCPGQAPFARALSQFARPASKGPSMLAVGAPLFLACATATYLLMARLRKLSRS
jgi:hypothetical protein